MKCFVGIARDLFSCFNKACQRNIRKGRDETQEKNQLYHWYILIYDSIDMSQRQVCLNVELRTFFFSFFVTKSRLVVE